MFKFNRIASLTVYSGAIALLALAPSPTPAQVDPIPPVRPSPSDWITFLQRQRIPPPRASRSGLCTISPGLVGSLTIWSDRPWFVWRGDGRQLNVRDRATQTLVWTPTLTTPDQPMQYNGELLQPGQIYSWQLLAEQPTASERNHWNTCQVMPAEQRQQITTELQTLEHQLQASGASREAIALQKNHYFAERELWSDALQMMYEVENPSAELTQAIETLLNQMCPESP